MLVNTVGFSLTFGFLNGEKMTDGCALLTDSVSLCVCMSCVCMRVCAGICVCICTKCIYMCKVPPASAQAKDRAGLESESITFDYIN